MRGDGKFVTRNATIPTATTRPLLRGHLIAFRTVLGTAWIAAGEDHRVVVDDRTPGLQVPAGLARLGELGQPPVADELGAHTRRVGVGREASTSSQASSICACDLPSLTGGFPA